MIFLRFYQFYFICFAFIYLEPEDIDFEAIALQKQKFKKKELDKQLFQNSSKFKFPTSLTNNAIKRACPDESSDEELRYSDGDGGEDQRDKETVHTKIKNGNVKISIKFHQMVQMVMILMIETFALDLADFFPELTENQSKCLCTFLIFLRWVTHPYMSLFPCFRLSVLSFNESHDLLQL